MSETSSVRFPAYSRQSRDGWDECICVMTVGHDDMVVPRLIASRLDDPLLVVLVQSLHGGAESDMPPQVKPVGVRDDVLFYLLGCGERRGVLREDMIPESHEVLYVSYLLVDKGTFTDIWQIRA
jgi:hypothetical protein